MLWRRIQGVLNAQFDMCPQPGQNQQGCTPEISFADQEFLLLARLMSAACGISIERLVSRFRLQALNQPHLDD
jgi:hypothetical protein